MLSQRPIFKTNYLKTNLLKQIKKYFFLSGCKITTFYFADQIYMSQKVSFLIYVKAGNQQICRFPAFCYLKIAN